jgi:hypothetical protein
MITHNADAFGRDASMKHARLLNAWNEGTISVQWEIAHAENSKPANAAEDHSHAQKAYNEAE